jgi:hypothetical protein
MSFMERSALCRENIMEHIKMFRQKVELYFVAADGIYNNHLISKMFNWLPWQQQTPITVLIYCLFALNLASRNKGYKGISRAEFALQTGPPAVRLTRITCHTNRWRCQHLEVVWVDIASHVSVIMNHYGGCTCMSPKEFACQFTAITQAIQEAL